MKEFTLHFGEVARVGLNDDKTVIFVRFDGAPPKTVRDWLGRQPSFLLTEYRGHKFWVAPHAGTLLEDLEAMLKKVELLCSVGDSIVSKLRVEDLAEHGFCV
jgi:hypothetical protein